MVGDIEGFSVRKSGSEAELTEASVCLVTSRDGRCATFGRGFGAISNDVVPFLVSSIPSDGALVER